MEINYQARALMVVPTHVLSVPPVLAEATQKICFVCALPTAFENVFGNAVLISCKIILALKAVDVGKVIMEITEPHYFCLETFKRCRAVLFPQPSCYF
jgi:hypothetical protein